MHFYAKCQLITDEAGLSEIVDELTQLYESSFEQPWQPSYASSMLEAIVGLRLEITYIQGKYKTSQNRLLDDQKTWQSSLNNAMSPYISRCYIQYSSKTQTVRSQNEFSYANHA